MMVRKVLASAAAAVLALSSAAWAADAASAPSDPYLSSPALSDGPVQAPLTLDITSSEVSTEPPPPPRPLMYLLQQAGVAHYLEDLGLDFHGYVEGGMFYDLNQPNQVPGGNNTGQGFNARKNAGTFDQAAFILDRPMDPSGDDWNFGFNVDVLWGHDDEFFHANGLGDSQVKHGIFNEHQWDLFQATVAVNFPVGNGLVLTGGKQESYFNVERVDPTQNMFYSHSYAFLFGRPYTDTGGWLDYWFSDDVGLSAGITRGWDQAWLDNNRSPEGEAQLTWHPDKHDTMVINFSAGPEAFHDDNDVWMMAEGIYTWKPDKADTGVIDGEYAYAPGVFNNGVGPATATWYGISGYLQHWWASSIATNVRVEWFRDNNGVVVVTTAPAAPEPGTGVSYAAATFGLTIKPLPNDPIGRWLQIRPEIRYDYGGSQRPFAAGTTGHEWTTAIDLVMEY
jgi:hypothetical protein